MLLGNDIVVDYCIIVMGVVCVVDNGEVKGFYIVDLGCFNIVDMSCFLIVVQICNVINVCGVDILIIDEFIKLFNQNFDVIGNDLVNILVGNWGNNVLIGGKGNDLFIGGVGNDSYCFVCGDGQDIVYDYDVSKVNVDIFSFMVV